MFLSANELQLGRGEPIGDTAEVISRMVDGIMIRTYGHDRIAEFARASRVPVINGLTDRFHPCQILADLFTWHERRGPITGRVVAWVGDGNNMANSWINAARLLDFELRVASPQGYQPDPELLAAAGDRVRILEDPDAAVEGADLVATDVWASMGQESEREARNGAFEPFRVDGALMGKAGPQALFMHCLPAHRGEEVTDEVLDGPQSVVWDEAENRLHAQKALLELLLG